MYAIPQLDGGSPRESALASRRANSVGVVDDAGADAAAEVRRDAIGDALRPAVGVEALEVETEGLGARPQVRVLEPALVVEQRVVHRPEGALRGGRLGGVGGGLRPRVAGPRRGSAGTRPAASRVRSRSSSCAQNGHS